MPLCRLVYSGSIKIWNSEWLGFNIDDRLIIDDAAITEMDAAVPVTDVNTFSPFNSSDDVS